MITECQIKAAIRATIAGKSRIELHDRGPRGRRPAGAYHPWQRRRTVGGIFRLLVS
jgi:hypothetical protein